MFISSPYDILNSTDTKTSQGSIDLSSSPTGQDVCPDCVGDPNATDENGNPAPITGCTDEEAQQCKIRHELFKHTQCGKEVFTKAVIEPMDLMEQEIRFGVVQSNYYK